MKRNVAITLILLSLSAHALADGNQSTMKEDTVQVKSWNHFSDLCLDLHQKQISGKKIKKIEKTGGYRANPEYYREVTYIDEATGNILSNIQWEMEHPDVPHSMEVFVYDKKGRVIRDYVSAYLPFQRNAPVQTLINIHNYNGDLHAFKQYDGSTDLVYEFCEGKLNGKEVQIRLFEDDLFATDYDARQLFKSPEYKACFNGMSSQVGKYIRPQ
ncbi:MAG: hypothetical protein GXP13_08585 [Gammaproteobacteria bacterium]|nr:hypothetical protein [Gammaproteobacteria bacterium]